MENSELGDNSLWVSVTRGFYIHWPILHLKRYGHSVDLCWSNLTTSHFALPFNILEENNKKKIKSVCMLMHSVDIIQYLCNYGQYFFSKL